ncbi:MAG: cAMP/cGMP-dependent 3',5'-cyclic-AMP/GMP phosphodiesterase [bacterium]|nr:cAMP/cGMP-dependent 3',5'-cyclic-AMP/GMP phosphodiesterase [bacterium]
MEPLKELKETVTSLPQGGYLLDSESGYIQFGAPPETIKDTMLLPKGVPLVFVLPAEFFNWIKGISIAELEFPIYYNFFIRKKKTRIVCYEEQAHRFTKVLKEALMGPANPNFPEDFDTEEPYKHDINKEMDYFRTMELDDVVEFCIYQNNTITIDGVTINIDSNGNFDVLKGEELLAYVPGRIEYKPKYLVGERMAEPYKPPLFGMTCLGPSSGFDPYENTSGFIIWLNHHGIMVDPPVNSTEWLLDSNVSPKFIDCIILTHCHADHDAGTFQKILEEWKITIYSTRTVMKSFLRKYAAFTGVSSEYLMSLFEFHPVQIGSPVFIHGGRFNMFYTLHSIPTFGFRMEFQNQSLTYSSDHNNDPELHKKLFDEGVISRERYDELSNFPWDSTVVYHESGVPPLHTPIDYLNSLPDNIRKKTIVYHIPKKGMPEETILTLAKFGIENTRYFNTKSPTFEKAYRILGLMRYLDFFQNISLKKVQEFISIVEEERFKKEEIVIQKGTEGDKFYILYSGNVSIRGDDEKYRKIFGAYDYFGEASLITGEKRSLDVVAETDVSLFAIEKDKFLNFIVGTEYEKALIRLADIRDNEAWEILSGSTFLKIFTATQRAFLETMLIPVSITELGVLTAEGEMFERICIIRGGTVAVSRKGEHVAVLQKGDIIGSVKEFYSDEPSSYAYSNDKPLSIYEVRKGDFKQFLEKNPGLVMKLEYIFQQYLFGGW